MHFGYSYYHQGDTQILNLERGQTADEFTPTAIFLGSHVAPMGIDFYMDTMFPQEYLNQAFIAEHGPYNRREKFWIFKSNSFTLKGLRLLL